MKKRGDSVAALFSYCEVPQDVGTRFFKAAGIVDRDHLSMCCTTTREEVEEVQGGCQGDASEPRDQGEDQTGVSGRPGGQWYSRATASVSRTAGIASRGIPSEVIMRKELATDVITLGDTVWQTSRAEIKLLAKTMIKKRLRPVYHGRGGEADGRGEHHPRAVVRTWAERPRAWIHLRGLCPLGPLLA